MGLYQHVRHPWHDERARRGPVKVADQHPADSRYARFNKAFAVWTTARVGTMTCAYAFAALALSSLPSTLALHSIIADVQWIAQTFFQLVLLSVILVGQNVQAQAADNRAQATYNDAEAVLHGQVQTANHLEAQDAAITRIQEHLAEQDATLGTLVTRLETALAALPAN